MTRHKILFIAYFYPPVGGKGLPGCQRSVKFVRYMKDFDKFVLTLQQNAYPIYFSLDNKVHLPINDEHIVRTGIFDVFNIFLNIKNSFQTFFSLNDSSMGKDNRPHQSQNKSSSDIPKRNKTLSTKIKDCISGILTFPDFANPWIIPATRQGKRLIKQKNIEYVFATGKPWSALIIGGLLKLSVDIKLIVDFRDPWVGNPFATEESNFRKSTERFIEKWIVRKADYVLLNTEELRELFIKKYSLLPLEKFITVPNGFDEEDFAGLHLQNKIEKNNGLTLLHAGFLYGIRDPKPIFKALRKINTNKIKMIQMGNTDLDYSLSEYIAKNTLEENFIDLGPVPYKQCVNKMTEADILLIIQPDTQTQIPSKLYEYIYLNKPILTIAPKDGALGKMVQKYHFGDIFEPNEINEISDYLQMKLEEKAEKGFLNANYANRDFFNVKTITKQLESILFA